MRPTECFRGVNCVTPLVIFAKWLIPDKLAVELSQGEIMTKTIYGVTVRTPDDKDPSNQSKPFLSLQDAENYIKDLKQEYRTPEGRRP